LDDVGQFVGQENTACAGVGSVPAGRKDEAAPKGVSLSPQSPRRSSGFVVGMNSDVTKVRSKS